MVSLLSVKDEELCIAYAACEQLKKDIYIHKSMKKKSINMGTLLLWKPKMHLVDADGNLKLQS